MLISTPIHYHRELKFSGLNEYIYVCIYCIYIYMYMYIYVCKYIYIYTEQLILAGEYLYLEIYRAYTGMWAITDIFIDKHRAVNI